MLANIEACADVDLFINLAQYLHISMAQLVASIDNQYLIACSQSSPRNDGDVRDFLAVYLRIDEQTDGQRRPVTKGFIGLINLRHDIDHSSLGIKLTFRTYHLTLPLMLRTGESCGECDPGAGGARNGT